MLKYFLFFTLAMRNTLCTNETYEFTAWHATNIFLAPFYVMNLPSIVMHKPINKPLKKFRVTLNTIITANGIATRISTCSHLFILVSSILILNYPSYVTNPKYEHNIIIHSLFLLNYILFIYNVEATATYFLSKFQSSMNKLIT